MTIKSVEQRFVNTDKVFREIREKEELARQAKNDRLRQARQMSQNKRTSSQELRTASR